MRTALAALMLIPTIAAAQDPAEGRDLFVTYCAVCHGTEARGDGPMAAVLTVLPADLTRLSGSGGDFPRLEVARKIDGRDPLLSHGGEMPLFGEFFSDENVAMTGPSGQPILLSRTVADIISWLETVQEPR